MYASTRYISAPVHLALTWLPSRRSNNAWTGATMAGPVSTKFALRQRPRNCRTPSTISSTSGAPCGLSDPSPHISPRAAMIAQDFFACGCSRAEA